LKRVLVARSCTIGGTDVVVEVKGIDELDVNASCRGAQNRGDRRGKIEVTWGDAAFAMICPALLLRLLKKAARLEKTES